MSRSLKKGPYTDPRIDKKIDKLDKLNPKPIKTWARACTISPQMVGLTFEVHNGLNFITVKVVEEMVGHRLGEFAPTRTFRKHGGKLAENQGRTGAAGQFNPTTTTDNTKGLNDQVKK